SARTSARSEFITRVTSSDRGVSARVSTLIKILVAVSVFAGRARPDRLTSAGPLPAHGASALC
ncbi:MAG TPA: hypothetical protein VFJ16_12675, partial [Longimicrobium sp.]|nr:hypothetical protein [Longimicrobium sp.]